MSGEGISDSCVVCTAFSCRNATVAEAARAAAAAAAMAEFKTVNPFAGVRVAFQLLSPGTDDAGVQEEQILFETWGQACDLVLTAARNTTNMRLTIKAIADVLKPLQSGGEECRQAYLDARKALRVGLDNAVGIAFGRAASRREIEVVRNEILVKVNSELSEDKKRRAAQSAGAWKESQSLWLFRNPYPPCSRRFGYSPVVPRVIGLLEEAQEARAVGVDCRRARRLCAWSRQCASSTR